MSGQFSDEAQGQWIATRTRCPKRLLKTKVSEDRKPSGASSDVQQPGDLQKRAAEAILGAIDEEGGVLPECIASWHRQFKPRLGRFRKFLRTHPELFRIMDIPGDCFVAGVSAV
eukprot:Skav226595  [mRNA]  locus=scaffold3446:55395:58508:+ [translate_table: standard]